MPHRRIMYQSALVVPVPGAEALVGSFRARYDPSAAFGMPAHVTINLPFLPGLPVDAQAIDQLTVLFSGLPSFRFSLIEARTFPDVLYLAPQPDEGFKRLILAVAGRFPGSQPYGGAFARVVPHLTVAQIRLPEDLEKIKRAFLAAAEGKLPIASLARNVWMMDNQNGRWEKRLAFRLGPVAPA